MSDAVIRLACWHSSDHVALCRIRQRVFMDEQGVSADLEWDSHDDAATHFLVEAGGLAIGCARLLPDGHIGRVALLPNWRGRGIGGKLVQAVIEHAESEGMDCLHLSAQTHVIEFYQLFGFRVCSNEYLDAGIPHVDMQRGDQ